MSSDTDATAATRRGRRAGSSGTRPAILAAARSRFASEGYGGTTIRKVAADASVNPALVTQFFSSKEELFVATLAMPENALSRISDAFEGDDEGLGERVTRAFLSLWEGPPEESEPLLALIRAAVSNETTSAQLSVLLQSRLVNVISPKLAGRSDSAARAGFAASMLIGVIIGRCIIQIPALAVPDQEAVVRMVGAAIGQILRDPAPLKSLRRA